MDEQLSVLLAQGKRSINELLLIEPDSRHKLLLELYAHVENETLPEHGFPDARHLFWDDPKSELEQQCLEDALRIFSYVR